MPAFDHLKLATRERLEVKRYCKALRKLRPGTLNLFDIYHEADGSCCKIEPVEQTMALLLIRCPYKKRILLFSS